MSIPGTAYEIVKRLSSQVAEGEQLTVGEVSTLAKAFDSVLSSHARWNRVRGDAYNERFSLGTSDYPDMRTNYADVDRFGWCARAIDNIADRLLYEGVKSDVMNLASIIDASGGSHFVEKVTTNALIYGALFVYIGKVAGDSSVRIQALDMTQATGIADPATGFLVTGYARLPQGHMALFMRDGTFYLDGDFDVQSVEVGHTGVARLQPITYRATVSRPFGNPLISNACIAYCRAACRTLARAEQTARFYSYPQRYASGVSQDSAINDASSAERWQAAVSPLLTFSVADDGTKPTLGSFQVSSMTPHVDMLKMYASLFAGQTGLTLDDLGFRVDNPTSAEAIKAGHETLRVLCRRAQRDIGRGLLVAGFSAACVRDSMNYDMRGVLGADSTTRIAWAPVFEPDASYLGGIGNGVAQLNAAVPNYMNAEALDELTGLRG